MKPGTFAKDCHAMEKVSWAARFEVAAGPRLSVGDTREIEAYDKLRVIVNPDAADKAVDLAPGAAGQVVLLVVTASSYDPPLTYKPDAAAGAIALDAPLILIGAAAVGLLGTPPTQFLWSNATGAAVTIDILAGRDATP
jgi:hypothetical protein